VIETRQHLAWDFNHQITKSLNYSMIRFWSFAFQGLRGSFPSVVWRKEIKPAALETVACGWRNKEETK